MNLFWEDHYRVTTDGKLFRLAGSNRCNVEREVKPSLSNSGYLRVVLSINGIRKKMAIHRMVGMTYIPNEGNKPQLDHIDRNKLNNDVSNLRWTTCIENNQNRERGISGELNIRILTGHYSIKFSRNKLQYQKYLPTNTSLADAVIQRDLMHSMFLDI